MNLNDWFAKGLTANEYISVMNVNKDGMDSIIEKFSLSKEEVDQLKVYKDKGLKAIALTEDWCGDAMLNNPILMKIAEEIGMEVRFLLRDQNLELMDQYLTNETSRAIPIYIFLNQNGEEHAVWGPRAKEIQKLVDNERSKLPSQDEPDFKELQSAMYKKLMSTYKEDSTIWHIVAKSIITTLNKE